VGTLLVVVVAPVTSVTLVDEPAVVVTAEDEAGVLEAEAETEAEDATLPEDAVVEIVLFAEPLAVVVVLLEPV
jgi:hypothetical protein